MPASPSPTTATSSAPTTSGRPATEAGIKPIIGIEAYLTPGTHRTDKTRVRWGERRDGDDVSGSGAYTHMTLLAREQRGHAQPVPAVVAGLASRGTTSSPGWTANCCSQYGAGIIATTGCPRGEIQTRLRLGQYAEAQAGGRRLPGHLRRRELLRRHRTHNAAGRRRCGACGFHGRAAGRRGLAGRRDRRRVCRRRIVARS